MKDYMPHIMFLSLYAHVPFVCRNNLELYFDIKFENIFFKIDDWLRVK